MSTERKDPGRVARHTSAGALMRLFAVISTAFALNACAEPLYSNIDNAELQTLIAQGVPLYDIRRAEEWRQTGVVAGSRALTFVDGGGRVNPDFMPGFTRDVRADQPVILICHSGNRSAVLARELTGKLGYKQVYNVRGGIAGWLGDARPVVAY